MTMVDALILSARRTIACRYQERVTIVMRASPHQERLGRRLHSNPLTSPKLCLIAHSGMQALSVSFHCLPAGGVGWGRASPGWLSAVGLRKMSTTVVTFAAISCGTRCSWMNALAASSCAAAAAPQLRSQRRFQRSSCHIRYVPQTAPANC